MIRIYQRDMKNILQSGQAGIDVTHYPEKKTSFQFSFLVTSIMDRHKNSLHEFTTFSRDTKKKE